METSASALHIASDSYLENRQKIEAIKPWLRQHNVRIYPPHPGDDDSEWVSVFYGDHFEVEIMASRPTLKDSLQDLCDDAGLLSPWDINELKHLCSSSK